MRKNIHPPGRKLHKRDLKGYAEAIMKSGGKIAAAAAASATMGLTGSAPSGGGKSLEISQHNDLSHYHVHCTYVPKEWPSGHRNTFLYQLTKTGYIYGSSGTQIVCNLLEIANNQQLSGTTSSGATLRSDNKWDVDPFLLNPYSTPPGNTIYTTAVPARGYMSSDEIRLLSCNTTISLLNMNSVPCSVEVNYLLCKRSDSNGPRNLGDTLFAAEGFRQVGNIATSTLSGTTAAGGSINNCTEYGVSPYSLRDFGRFWTSIGHTKFILQPGDERSLTWKITWNKLITKAWLEQQASNTYLAGITVVPLLIVRGGMVGVASEAGAEASDVTYSELKVGVISQHKYKFGAVPVNRYKIQRIYQGELVNVESVGTQKEKQINDVDVVGVTQRV